MARRRNEQPLRVTRIRVIPCEDVDAVFNAVIKRVLNAQNAVPAQPGDGESARPGDDGCPS